MKTNKVLLLGSGALKIGEAGEFDYSGTQAIKALKEEKIEIILVNPNVATIQTSEGLADKIYFLPVTPFFVEKIIKKEKPDGILLSFGGQTALNCGLELFHRGIFKKHQVQVLGTPISAVIDTEDRKRFTQRLMNIGLKTARGKAVSTVKKGLGVAKNLGFPVMVRTGFALGGTGSGIAQNVKQLEQILTNALAASPQAIVEECLTGWKEVEYEVVRDKNDNCITVCNMENFDPVGIHTGESIVVAPSQTLNNEEYFALRQVAIDTIREFKIVGECNIQFALNPKKFDYRIIEVNARLSRSSALASKATGYPLAYVAAKLALGKTLPELKNLVTGKTSAFFEPALDYIVVKLPRWDLDKLVAVEESIGSEMKSVGEVMSIARTFPEAIQKATRMLNDGYKGVIDVSHNHNSQKELLEKLRQPTPLRLFTICSALYKKVPVKTIAKLTGIDAWFIEQLKQIVQLFDQLNRKPITYELLKTAKEMGFSDSQIADIYKLKEATIRNKRLKWGITPKVKRIDTMAGEFPAATNYLYMTYNASESDHLPNSTIPSGFHIIPADSLVIPAKAGIYLNNSLNKSGKADSGQARMTKNNKNNKVAVIGSGPYAIGTSVEFDWCAVNTVTTLRQRGIATIMINCNPETVSTDYDYSDYLYFEELTLERMLDIYDLEQAPFIVSVGGQIPNNLAPKLKQRRIPILGTQPEQIHLAEHRKSFSEILDKLSIKQPAWAKVGTVSQALRAAAMIGYPILVRPSFVLSGKAMNLIYSEQEFKDYLNVCRLDLKEYPLVMSKFLAAAVEVDFDAVAQNGQVMIFAISEHVEHGGVHSGDATLMLPAVKINAHLTQAVSDTAAKIIKELKVNGPVNIQFLIYKEELFVIECNLRASRSFPFVSKTLGHNFISLATEIALGKKSSPIKLPKKISQAVKVAQFSFRKLRGADPVLRVEMSSTGEVVGFGRDAYEAFLLGELSTGKKYPTQKSVFLSLGGMRSKLAFLESVRELVFIKYKLYATSGTALFLKENGIETIRVGKIYEGIRPTAIDLLIKKLIDFAIVVPETTSDTQKNIVTKSYSDGYQMRRLAIDLGVALFTNIESARFFIRAISKYKLEDLSIKSWSEWIN